MFPTLKNYDPGIRMLIIACALCGLTLFFHAAALSGLAAWLRGICGMVLLVFGHVLLIHFKPGLDVQPMVVTENKAGDTIDTGFYD